MEAIRLISKLRGENISTDASSALQESFMLCQEGSDCDCKGCSDSG